MQNRIVVGVQHSPAKLCIVSSQLVFCHLVFQSTINCEAIHPQLINGRGRKVPQHTEGQCYLAMSLVCISCIVYELQGNKYDKFKDIIDVPVLK